MKINKWIILIVKIFNKNIKWNKGIEGYRMDGKFILIRMVRESFFGGYWVEWGGGIW